jgi:fructokinase
VSMDASLRLGVDLGGTKTEAVVIRARDTDAGAPEILARMRVPTVRDEGYDHVVATTAKLIDDVKRAAGLDVLPPVGVGMPGSVTYRRADGSRSEVPLVKNSNTTCLNGRPFRADLAAAVRGDRAIAFANDANCFALAEARYGAARGARVAFGIILGTGVGGGVVLRSGEGNAVAWDGLHGIAGEWGHVVLDPTAALPCYCGRRGCIERYLSGPAIEAAYQARSGEKRDLAAIGQRRDTDPHARATLDAVVDTFGRAVATLIDILDPDAIVLGGGVSNLPLFYDEGRAAVARWVFNDELRTPIVKNELGDSAGVIGAALLTH